LKSIPWKPWVGWVVRLGLTILILWLAMRKVPLAAVPVALKRLNLPLAASSVALFVLGNLLIEPLRLLAAGRLLRERQPRFTQWLNLYAESRPFYYVLPAAAGAEGMVWLRLRQFQWGHASCGFVVFITRLVGVSTWALAAALAVGSPGSAALLAQAPAFMRSPSLWGTMGALVLVASILAPGWMRRWKHLPVRDQRAKAMTAVVLLSPASAMVNVLAVHAGALAAHTSLGLVETAGLLGFFNFAMILPVSLGGFGLQEALVLGLGLPLGYPAPALLAFSIVMHFQRLALSITGLGAFLRPIPVQTDCSTVEG
jgi:uncharacterized membrane protein YbhN (UPF0104 family)